MPEQGNAKSAKSALIHWQASVCVRDCIPEPSFRGFRTPKNHDKGSAFPLTQRKGFTSAHQSGERPPTPTKGGRKSDGRVSSVRYPDPAQ